MVNWIDESRATTGEDESVAWYSAESLPLQGRGFEDVASRYDRLPEDAESLVRPEVWRLSRHSSGLRIPFVTDSPEIHVRWRLTAPPYHRPHVAETAASGLDLYGRETGGAWRFIDNARPRAQDNSHDLKMRGRRFDEYLLYLPLYNGVETLEVGIANGSRIGAPAAAREDKRKPIVFYGTSITQGACASRPGMAAVSIVSRRLDWPFVNLGFSGNGRMDLELVDYLDRIDAAIYVLDNFWNMSDALIRERLKSFVRALRERRPAVPIVIIEDTSYTNVCPTHKGRIARGILAELEAELTAEGITPDIEFIESRDMLGDDWEGTVDGVHHNDLGMMRQAEVVAPVLKRILERRR